MEYKINVVVVMRKISLACSGMAISNEPFEVGIWNLVERDHKNLNTLQGDIKTYM